ncbi:MAG TPA: M28 family peptidase [Nitrospirota bacterium]|nr:M28 family peptidase [Nitrospirota bacterium]
MLSHGIGVRTYRDTDRLQRAAGYISEQFRSFGYDVSRQAFLYRGNAFDNVIAELTGNAAPEKILVVGAHYDTVRTTSGADDNASGVAGLLGLAKALEGKKLTKTVRFVAFALEEPPVSRTRNMGSYHYAQSLKEKKEQVMGMVCLEMIGFFCDRDGSQHYPLPFFKLRYPSQGNFISMVGNLRSRAFTKRIAAGFRKAVDLPLVTLNAPSIVIGIDFSDHWSFNKFRYDSLMVTDTAFYRNPNYHAPTDLWDTLDYRRMAMVVEGLAAAVVEWGGTDGDEG